MYKVWQEIVELKQKRILKVCKRNIDFKSEKLETREKKIICRIKKLNKNSKRLSKMGKNTHCANYVTSYFWTKNNFGLNSLFGTHICQLPVLKHDSTKIGRRSQTYLIDLSQTLVTDDVAPKIWKLNTKTSANGSHNSLVSRLTRRSSMAFKSGLMKSMEKMESWSKITSKWKYCSEMGDLKVDTLNT